MLHHHVSGSGPPLLLVHPSGQDSRIWETVVPGLDEFFTVITIDRRGHGRNADHDQVRAVDASTIAELNAVQSALREAENDDGGEAGDIETLLRVLGHPVVSTLGVTDGGLVGYRLASRGHVEVPAMITVDTTVAVPLDVTLEQILEQADEIGRDLPALGEVLPQVLANKDPAPLVRWAMSQDDLGALSPHDQARMQAILQDNALPSLLTVAWPQAPTTEALNTITGRVLALHGNPRAQRADELLPSAAPHAEITLDTIPHTLPCYPMSMPEDCRRRVIAFLADDL